MKCSRCGHKISEGDNFEYENQPLCRECFSNNKEFVAQREVAIEQVNSKLWPLSDAISLVVTGHLLIEYWLDWLMKFKITHPAKLFDAAHLTFSQKLSLAESLGLISDKCSKGIRALNSIRNHFSHDLEYQISEKDLGIFQEFLPSLSKEEQSTYNMLGSPKKELISFCVFFAGYANGYAYSYAARSGSTNKPRRQKGGEVDK